MNKPIRRPSLGLLASTILLSTSFPVSAWWAATSETPNGRAPIRLRMTPNVCFQIQSDFKPGRPQLSGKLVAIDGVNMKGKSEQQISDLLLGPTDSKVDISYLEPDDTLHTTTVQREPLRKGGNPALTDLNRTFSNFEHDLNSAKDNGSAARQEEQNLELITRADAAQEVLAAQDLPGDHSSAVGARAAQALLLYDMVGDFPGANRYLKLVLRYPVFDTRFGDLRVSTAERIMDDLTVTNRLPEAAEFGQKLQEAMKRSSEQTSNGFQNMKNNAGLSRAYAKVLLAQGKTREAGSLLSATFATPSDAMNRVLQYPQDMAEVTDLLDRADKTDLAIEYYQQNLKNSFVVRQQNANLSLDAIRQYNFDSIMLATLQEKQGKIDEAIATLQNALEQVKAHTTDDTKANAEKLPLYFPAPSDLETKLADLYLKNSKIDAAKELAQSAVQKVEKATGQSSIALRRPLTELAQILKQSGDEAGYKSTASRIDKLLQPAPPPLTETQQVSLLKAAASATGSELKKKIDQCLDAYEQQEPNYDFQRRPLNLYAALINLARVLSDRGLFTDSNYVLDKLDTLSTKESTPVVGAFIKLERAINAERQKAKSDWNSAITSFALTPSLVPTESSSQSSEAAAFANLVKGEEIFRTVAVMYVLTGDSNRAKMLIKEALAERAAIEASPKATIFADKYALERAKVFLLLDAARVSAQTGQPAEAQKLGRQAVTLCAATLPPTNREARQFNETYRLKIVQLARCLSRSGLPNSEVENYLQFVQQNISKGASSDVELEARSLPRTYGGYYSLIDTELARLNFQDNNTVAAANLATKAIELSGTNVPFEVWRLGADVAYKAGDFKNAAHRYSEAEKVCSFMDLNFYANEERTACIRRAVESADKAKGLDNLEAANIYVRAAQSLQQSNPQESSNLYEKAYKLTPDSDPQKATLLSRITSAKGAIATAQAVAAIQQKTPKPDGKSGLGGEGIVRDGTTVTVLPPPLTPEQLEKVRSASAKAQVVGLRQAANLTEKSNSPTAAAKWAQVAQTEAEAGLLDKAIVDAKHAISLIRSPGDVESPEPFPGATFSAGYGLITTLSKSGKSQAAEGILQDALKALQSAYGDKSAAAASQLEQLMEFYFNENKTDAALKCLDQLLQFDLRTLELGRNDFQSASGELVGLTTRLAKNGQGDLALKIRQQVLDAQRKTFEADDLRIATTLMNIADLELTMNKASDAETHALAAARILKLYYGIYLLSPINGAKFAGLWQKIEPNDPKAIEVRYQGKISPSLLRKIGDDAAAQRIEQLQKHPDQAVDPSFPNEHGHVSFDPKADKLEQEAQLQKEYADACVDAPYGRRAAGALQQLIRISSQLKDWEVLAKASTARAAIYEREPDNLAGRSFGCVPPDTNRLDYYSGAAKAYIALGKDEEAKKWIERGIKNMPEKTCMEYITLADLELQCGDQTLASKYADLADKVYTDQYFAVYPWQAAAVWKKLGQPARAEASAAKREEANKRHEQQRQQVKQNVFNYAGN